MEAIMLSKQLVPAQALEPNMDQQPSSHTLYTRIRLATKSPPFTSFTILLLEASSTPLSLHHQTLHLPRPLHDPEAADFLSEQPGSAATPVTIAGYVLFSPNYAPFLAKPGFYVEHLFVREAYRRHGLGRELMKAVSSQAVRLGYGRVDWVVLDWNVDAVRFYEKIGADVMAEYRLCRLTGDALLSYGKELKPTSS